MHVLDLVMTLLALEILVCQNSRSQIRTFFLLDSSFLPLIFARAEVSYASQRSQSVFQRVETLVYKYESLLMSNISILRTIAESKKMTGFFIVYTQLV